ncbi:MAG: transposase [Muribaculaceae bacterium]|nr:transposase [Muribaculaceae bacterium]
MNSLSLIYVMFVFSVKYRLGMIHPVWRERLYSVMGQTLKDMQGVYPLQIGGVADHVHVLLRTEGIVAESEIMRKLKSESSQWINRQGLVTGRFAWQRGGARISYSPSSVDDVCRYIANQESHHRRLSFREEIENLYRSVHIQYTEYDLPSELE